MTEDPRNNARRRILERLVGPRIAQKIFLGYILPLALLLSFGIVLPIFLWFVLGSSIQKYEDLSWIADHAVSLRRNAIDTESHVGGYIRYHDQAFLEQYLDARDAYRTRFRDIDSFIDQRGDPELVQTSDAVGAAFGNWLDLAVRVPYEIAIKKSLRETPRQVAISQSRAIHDQFDPVLARIDQFIKIVNVKRSDQAVRARAADLMRQITSVVIPLVAVLLSLLVGRSTALGITRPLAALMIATRDLEAGTDSLPTLLGELEASSAADDEISDLQHSFRQMARTIRQREAVLHAQNEAVGALNRRIESVLNATNDGILMLDRAGGFSVVNQRLADLFGLEIDHLLDHTFAQAGPLLFARFKNKEAIHQRLEELVEDADNTVDETYDLSEPHGRTVRLYSAPVRGHRPNYGSENSGGDLELLGRIFVFRDVTRETMLDRMKTEFVSTVSHELRTPLTAIKGYVDLMVSGQTGPLTDVQSEFLTLVQGSTRRLTDLINDMLDVSRMESGRIELRHESVDYIPLVRETVRMMSHEAEAKNIGISVEVLGPSEGALLPMVRGDADRITQVLTNFLSNSIKYTPAGGQIRVILEFEDDFVTTCVADTGIGIGPEDQRRLFQKFFRADNSTTREAGGTGLGLAITKAILEKLNGSVWVESQRGVGSQFYFTLPCADSATAATLPRDPDGTRNPFPTSGTLVLPVTSDLATLHRLGHELRRQHFVTSGASTAAEAIRRVRDLHPDIVLIDPLAPNLDTRDILRQIYRLGLERVPPIVVASFQMQSNNIAGFRDDVALIPAETVSCDELQVALRAAVETASRRGDGSQADPASLTVLGIGAGGFAAQLRSAVDALESPVELTIAGSQEAVNRYLHGESAPRAPDILVVAEDVDSGLDIETWLAKARRRRPETAIVCILVVEADVFHGLDLSVLAPVGGGTIAVDDVGRLLRATQERSRVNKVNSTIPAAPAVSV